MIGHVFMLLRQSATLSARPHPTTGQTREKTPNPIESGLGIRFCARIAVGVGVLVLMTTCANIVLGRQQPVPIDPLSEWVPLIGQFPAVLWETGFACQTESEWFLQMGSCFSQPEVGPFKRVQVTFINSRINQVIFTVRENTLLLGHLTTCWGEPRIERFTRYTRFSWPDQEILAIAYQPGRVTMPRLPINVISLGGMESVGGP
jgi:hypothetical protein